MSYPSDRTIVFLALIFIAGLRSVYLGTKKLLLYMKINNTPTSKVEAAALGIVELNGKVRSDGKTLSPLSGAKCGYWLVQAQYLESRELGRWHDFYKKMSPHPFYVEDVTGKMLVDPEGAVMDIPMNHQFTGNISGKANPKVPNGQIDARALKFIDGLDDSTKAKFMEHKDDYMFVQETYLAEGDEVYVLGTAEQRKNVPSAIGYENLIVRKGKDLMYIRDSSERKILADLKSEIHWQLIGGTLAACISLFLFLFVFNV